MNSSSAGHGRKLLAGGALALATAGLTFGIAGAANAAVTTDSDGRALSDIRLTPKAPATDFSVPGTTGTLTFEQWDGVTSPGSTFTYQVGGEDSRTITLPEGLVFSGSCKDSETASTKYYCTVSEDGRTRTSRTVYTQPVTIPATTAPSTASYPVTSTGLVSGAVTVSLAAPTGTTSHGPLTLSAIPVGSVAPLVVSGAGQADGSGSVPLTGTAEPGATVTVKDAAGDLVGTKIVGVDGAWSVPVPSGTSSPLSITQTVGALTGSPVTFDVAALPVWPGLAAAGALLVAGFGGSRLIRRTRNTTHA
ncbi:Ig-like domain-containing protein [Leifsonia shinshuensis]|uniref:Ig-like domain-containing protein n=1 Tax=Leifsonia shinshuensis TaxID=150026 RepID=UPI0028542F45|nr:Ig-like domain-containing protein [Leifsonia shinshuensis]MDR6970587.1 hypothetical protein [Leifsonia shinshuensis]